jgi:hypothetical protein
MVITGTSQIMMTRALSMKHALRLEVRSGLKVSNKFNVYKLVKEEFGFKGSKQKVLEQLEAYIDKKLKRIYVPPEDGKPHCVYETA